MDLCLRLRALAHCRATLGGIQAAAHGGGRCQRRRTASSSAFCSLAVASSGNGAAAGPVGSGVEVARSKRMLHVVLVSPMRFIVDNLKLTDSVNENRPRLNEYDMATLMDTICKAKENDRISFENFKIPGNTGSIARTCAAAAVGLHLVGPLGYNIDDTKLKRAGLDYWPYVVVKVHDTWDEFRDYFMQQDGEKRLLAFTKRGTRIHSDFAYKPGDWLVFGSETKGLPDSALDDCSGEALGGGTIRIPMVETYVRCLNLSVSVGVALYEAARQLNYEQLQYQADLPEEAQGLFPAEDIYG